MIITGDVDDELLEAAGKKCNNNIVVVGNYDLRGEYGQVTTCFDTQLQQSLELAAQHGCKRFAALVPPETLKISLVLRRIIKEFTAQHGFPVVFLEHDDHSDSYKLMAQLEDFKPDCVLLTEPTFSGAWEYMLEHSLHCPEDIFLIRYGKEYYDNTFPGKAAVELEDNSVIHGKTALEMLLNNCKEITKIDMELRSYLKEK